MTKDDYRKVIQDFLDKYDQCEPYITGAFVMALNHGSVYKGPNWSQELKALRDVARQ